MDAQIFVARQQFRIKLTGMGEKHFIERISMNDRRVDGGGDLIAGKRCNENAAAAGK